MTEVQGDTVIFILQIISALLGGIFGAIVAKR